MLFLSSILFLQAFLSLASPIHEDCIDTSGSHIVSVNCDGTNCFFLSSSCAFNTYSITVYNRKALKVAAFNSSRLEDINRYMNYLKYDSSLVSGTYFALLKATSGSNYQEKKFSFVLYK